MNEYAESLLKLPGRPGEKEWLEARLEMLSVKEGIVLAAAVERSPPATMADAVNHLLTLDKYTVCSAGSYAQLGEFYLMEQCVPQEQRPFFDHAALGQWYEDEHPGLFVGNSYVAYPEQDAPVPYDGTHLPIDVERLDWSVRLKLASEAVPEGVWVKFPDYDEFENGKSSDFRLALDALKWMSWRNAHYWKPDAFFPVSGILLPNMGGLVIWSMMGRTGIMLDERGQGNPDYLDRLFAALDYEYCHRLDDAVRIAEGLSSYDIISKDKFLDDAMQELSKQPWAKGGEGVKNCFDYVAYADALAERQGYTMTDDEQFYIRKRDSPELEPQQGGMTM